MIESVGDSVRVCVCAWVAAAVVQPVCSITVSSAVNDRGGLQAMWLLYV